MIDYLILLLNRNSLVGPPFAVMPGRAAGRDPGIHDFFPKQQDVDARAGTGMTIGRVGPANYSSIV
jgi:hypothetical protein